MGLSSPKPVSEIWQPELTRLPSLTLARRSFRRFFKGFCKFIVFACTRTKIKGLENYPRRGAAIVVINHLGDPDAILTLAALPDFPEVIGKIELRSIPVLRLVTDMLGIIWVHRGQPDRRAMTAALEALHGGRRIIIAPEGRESVSGGLEAGTDGAAYLAIKSGAPVVPVTITGSEFRLIENGLKKWRRVPVEVKVGIPFTIPPGTDRKEAVKEGTRKIMEGLARQLPAPYRGFYAYIED
jgi:1-acyl-sn-glycerol-3-phosphate acyltransferase